MIQIMAWSLGILYIVKKGVVKRKELNSLIRFQNSIRYGSINAKYFSGKEKPFENKVKGKENVKIKYIFCATYIFFM